jgi:hypothetical protein
VSFRVVYGTEAVGILLLTGFFSWMARDADRRRAAQAERAATEDPVYAADSIDAS